LSISGSWTNATAGESQDIALSKLKNSIVTAENNYINALSNYLQEGQSLSLRIMQWEYKCSQHESEMDYLEAQYKTQKELYELGLVAEEKVKDALWKLDEARGDWNVLMLEGESLRCDLAVYAL
jgi:multidrug resistance efflux pump